MRPIKQSGWRTAASYYRERLRDPMKKEKESGSNEPIDVLVTSRLRRPRYTRIARKDGDELGDRWLS